MTPSSPVGQESLETVVHPRGVGVGTFLLLIKVDQAAVLPLEHCKKKEKQNDKNMLKLSLADTNTI